MKAEIDENGKLKITPENGIESFALKMWWDDYMKAEQDARDGKSGQHYHFAVLHIETTEGA